MLSYFFRRSFVVHDPAKTSKKLIVLVTGASTGIGLDAAFGLASKGFYVYATVRKPSDAAKLERLNESSNYKKDGSGGKKGFVEPVVMDVTDFASMQRVQKKIQGEVDAGAIFVALVNNAGVAAIQLTEVQEMQEIEWMYSVNVFGVMQLTKLMLPLLRQSKGRIVVVGSAAGKTATPLATAYASTKFAVEGYCDSLRRELLDLGVSVSLLEPGYVASEMSTTKMRTNDVLDPIPENLRQAYKDVLKPYERDRGDKDGSFKLPPASETTTPAIVDAILSEYPQTRYAVAASGRLPMWVSILIASILPDRALDNFILARKLKLVAD